MEVFFGTVKLGRLNMIVKQGVGLSLVREHNVVTVVYNIQFQTFPKTMLLCSLPLQENW